MTDFIDDVDAEEWAEFERLGRRAGAELRTAPPEDGLHDLQRAVRHRAATRAAAGCVVFAMLAVGAWAVLRGRRGDESPVDQTPVPTVPLPVGAPGTWRPLSAPADAPDIVFSATWTGTDVIALGAKGTETVRPAALAYDVRRDSWRRLPAPPADVDLTARTAWTGSAVLTADGRGHVDSFDPIANAWQRRAAPSADLTWGDSGGLVAVSPSGVLTRSKDAWLWYDEASDTWTRVGSADSKFDDSLVIRNGVAPSASLDALTTNEFVLAHYREGAIQFVTFDADTGVWSSPQEAESPAVTRGNPWCQAAGGRLVCIAEGYGTLNGRVIDTASGDAESFTLDHNGSAPLTYGTPWFGHAWSLLLARTATWERLPTLQGTEGFNAAVWDGEELIMFGGQSLSGVPASRFAAAYTPVVKP